MQVAVGKTYTTKGGRAVKIEKVDGNLVHWRYIEEPSSGICSVASFISRVKEADNAAR